MKKLGLVALLVVLTLIVTPAIVRADPWSALEGSGYAVTLKGFPLEEVYPGEEVTAYAGTIDSEVTHVVFNWLAPDGTVYPIPGEPIAYDTDPIGTYSFEIYYSTCTVEVGVDIPAIYGDWGVQAEFWGPGGKLKGTGGSEGIIKIRATSLFVIPEVQMGTITILLTMLASLAVFARKRF